MKGNIVGQGGIKINGGAKRTRTVATNKSIKLGDLLYAPSATTVETSAPHTFNSVGTLASPFSGGVVDGSAVDIQTLKLDEYRNAFVLADGTNALRITVGKYLDGNYTIGTLTLGSGVAKACNITHWHDNYYVVIAAKNDGTSVDIHVITITDTTITLVQSTTLAASAYYLESGVGTIGLAYVSNDMFTIFHRTSASLYARLTTMRINRSTNVASLTSAYYGNAAWSAQLIVRKVKGDRVLSEAQEGTPHVLRLYSINTTTGDITVLTSTNFEASTSNSACLINLTDTLLVGAVALSGNARRKLISVLDNDTLSLSGLSSLATNTPNNVDLVRISDDTFLSMGSTSGSSVYGFLRVEKALSNFTIGLFGVEANGAGNFGPTFGQYYGVPKLVYFDKSLFAVAYKGVGTTYIQLQSHKANYPVNSIALANGASAQTVGVLEVVY